MATLQCDSHPYRKVFDTLVVGYLNRQNYCESARCLLNESTTLRNIARLPDQSVAINDVVHGKHLEQIMQTFIERGDFEVGPVLFDFGNRLRALANEFIALTNADAYWSDAQRTLYGKRVPPSKSNSSEGPRSATQVIVYPNSAQQSMSCVGASNAHAIGYGSASTRRLLKALDVLQGERMRPNVVQLVAKLPCYLRIQGFGVKFFKLLNHKQRCLTNASSRENCGLTSLAKTEPNVDGDGDEVVGK
ncbi:hypothetical protein Tcan_06461 [Toxocara canis]|uniref:Uncharacterized protein n=1 Tax=Toxocara canis TaxID=6265 RepID=A0A0B2VHK2_TOXCA|nr:hypothetical protein Tcan_06461 [Toxocara canis]